MTVGKVLLTSSGLALVASVVLLMLFGVFDSAPSSTPPPPTSAAQAFSGPSLAETDAEHLAEAVTSGDERRLREVVAVPSDQALDPAAVSALKQVGPLVFVLPTFRDLGDGRAEIVAKDKDGTPWLVGVVMVGRQWRIASAEPAP